MFNSTQSDYIRCTSLMYRLGKEQYIPISHIRCTMVHSQVSLRLNQVKGRNTLFHITQSFKPIVLQELGTSVYHYIDLSMVGNKIQPPCKLAIRKTVTLCILIKGACFFNGHWEIYRQSCKINSKAFHCHVFSLLLKQGMQMHIIRIRKTISKRKFSSHIGVNKLDVNIVTPSSFNDQPSNILRE